MRQLCRSMLTRVRLLATAALVAFASLTSSTPIVRPALRYLDGPIVIGGSQAGHGHSEIIERIDLREAPVDVPRPRFLTATDRARVQAALDAATRRDWETARELAAGSAVRLARKLIEWRYLLDPRS